MMVSVHSGQEAVIPTEIDDLTGAQWYDECGSMEAIAWVRDHLVEDLEATADGLRRRADFIDGKASLLFDIMTAVMAGKQDADTDGLPVSPAGYGGEDGVNQNNEPKGPDQ